MAHHKSAIKRLRQTKRRRLFNRQKKKSLRLAIRSVRESKTFEDAIVKFRQVTSLLDRTSAKGIIHKNNAANKKSKLAKFVYAMKANSTVAAV